MTYKNKKTLLIVIMSVLMLIFALTLSLFLYQRAYAGRILNNVFYNGVNLTGKTKSQIKTIIENDASPLLDNKIVVKSEAGKEYTAPFSQTGISPDINNTVDIAFSYGRDDQFMKMLFKLAKTVVQKEDIGLDIEFNEEEYQAYISRAQENLNMPPVDASLSIKNGEVITNTGKNGNTIDASGLKKSLTDQFFSGSETATLEIPITPVTPTLLTDNLATAKSMAEKYLSHNMTLTYNGQNYSVGTGDISSWISFGLENGKYSAWLNNSAIKNYLAKIAAKNDVPVIDKKLSATDLTHVLQEGRQGVYLNQDDTLDKIVAALNSTAAGATIAMVSMTKEPQILTVFPDEGIVPGRFPGKYIDIDVAHQLLTLFDGTNQIGQYIISSGKASTPTPVGTRTIQGHGGRAWSAPYGLYMPYFMSMGGGYGIHELPEWPNGYKEGESHLGTPVSHGCVRLGVGPAEFVYNWSPDGTPVYIHK